MAFFALGDGDFTVDSKAEELYVGDFQKLKASMDEIIEKLSLMMVKISQSSDQILPAATRSLLVHRLLPAVQQSRLLLSRNWQVPSTRYQPRSARTHKTHVMALNWLKPPE